MKWPRGKNNGQRIVGFSVKAQIQVRYWFWKPMIGNHCGMFHWLCFMSWWEAVYE